MQIKVSKVNPLTGTFKPLSNGPLCSSTVIGTLAVDGWAVTFGTARSLGQWRNYKFAPPAKAAKHGHRAPSQ